MILRQLVLMSAFTLCAAGQPWTEIGAWKQPADEQRIAPKAGCASLRSLTGFEFSVISAAMVGGSGGSAEFCRVTGLIQPEIRFEVGLPASWHGRLVMFGNGGYAGENLDAPQRARMRDTAVEAGFAFTHTNTGHDAEGEPLGAFATSAQKLADYAFRAVHVTAETSKKIAAAYYGVAPKRAYFVGCSTGGRQALISAQRFPADFDGILAGAPVLDFTGTMMKYVSVLQAMSKAPLSEAKLRQAGEAIYARCDDRDGVKDGVLEDPRNCDFKPSVHLTKCKGGEGPNCFTEGQIRVLEILYSDQHVNGQRVFAGWPLGAEATSPTGRPSWNPWLVRENGPPISELFSEAFFRYLALPKKDPDLRLSEVDLERIAPQMEWIRNALNATDTDLSGFRDRGGKLLMWFGWADPALNPMMGVEYYEAVVEKMGSRTHDFFRLFMMPGVFHCSGGPGCDAAPRLAALIDWVERGKAPDKIEASRTVHGKVVRTRPLCAYPAFAKYKGTGSVDEATSFECETAP